MMVLIIIFLVSSLLSLVIGAYAGRQFTRESAYTEGWHEGYTDAMRPAA